MKAQSMKPQRARWVRRTNVYIAEYILMLVLFGSFIGILTSLWFSFFDLIYTSDYAAREIAKNATMQLASLFVVGPAAYWLYARTSGQEIVQTELVTRRSRTVFLSIWVFIVGMAIVTMLITVATAFAQAIFGVSEADFAKVLVTKVLPSLFGVATITVGVFAIVKQPARTLTGLIGAILAGIAVVMIVLNVVMILVRKDIQKPVVEKCNISRYIKKECTYRQYLNDKRSVDSSSDRYDTELDDLFRPSKY